MQFFERQNDADESQDVDIFPDCNGETELWIEIVIQAYIVKVDLLN